MNHPIHHLLKEKLCKAFCVKLATSAILKPLRKMLHAEVETHNQQF